MAANWASWPATNRYPHGQEILSRQPGIEKAAVPGEISRRQRRLLSNKAARLAPFAADSSLIKLSPISDSGVGVPGHLVVTRQARIAG
jgi:hypothetical protein